MILKGLRVVQFDQFGIILATKSPNLTAFDTEVEHSPAHISALFNPLLVLSLSVCNAFVNFIQCVV